MFYNRIIASLERRSAHLNKKKIIQYSIHADQRLRGSTLLFQMLGLFAWLCALPLTRDIKLLEWKPVVIYAAGMMTGMIVIAMRGAWLSGFCGKLIYTSFLAQSLCMLIDISSNQMFWPMALFGLLVVGMAPSFHEPVSFTACSIIAGLHLLPPYWEVIARAVDFDWIVCFLVVACVFSLVTNLLFTRERIRVYAAQRGLAKLAFSDSLTGINNRRSFLRSMEEALMAKSPQDALYLFMIDVDDFKAVNDRHGHDVGDVVLQEVAARIKEITTARRCGRLGGEEFAAFLVGNLPQVHALGARLNQAIKDRPMNGLSISISIGIASSISSGTIHELLVDADRQLYRAKKAGKNQYAMDPSISQAYQE